MIDSGQWTAASAEKKFRQQMALYVLPGLGDMAIGSMVAGTCSVFLNPS